MTLSPPGDPTHLVKQMLPKVQRSSVAGMWRFAGLAGVIAASLALAGCGERRPLAGTPIIATTGAASIAVAEATPVSPATHTAVPTATATAAPPSPAPSPTPTVPPATPPPAADVGLEVLGQQWGQAAGIAVADSVAYTAIGPRVVALDATAPTALAPLGQSVPLPGVVGAVVASDGLVYAGAGSSVVALDVADPAAIALRGQLELDGVVTQLALRDNVLFVGLSRPAAGDPTGGVWAIDVSAPDQLRALDSAALPWAVHALALGDDHPFAANPATTDFYAVDISNPADLLDAVAVPGVGLTYSLSLAGNVLVAGGGVSDLHAWDVSDPLRPQPLWDVQAPPDAALGLGVVEDFVLAGERAFLAVAGYSGDVIGVLPVELPAAVPAGTDGTLTSSKLAIADGRAFFARGNVTAYDLANPSAAPLSRYELPSVGDVDMMGDIGIVLAGNQLLTLGLPDLTVLGAYTGEVHCQPCYAAYLDVTLASDVAYVSAADDGLRIISLADPAAPALLGSLDATTGYAELRVGSVAAGQLVYLADAGVCDGPNLLAFDLADPATPRRVDALSNAGCIAALDAADGRLYAAGNFADRPGGALTIFTESAAGPQPAGSLEWPEPISSVAGFGDFALVGTEAGLAIVSVADPTTPLAVAALPVPGGVQDIAVVGSLALVTTASEESQLLAVDLGDPSAPRQVSAVALPSAGMRVAAAGGYVLVGDVAAGIVVLRVVE